MVRFRINPIGSGLVDNWGVLLCEKKLFHGVYKFSYLVFLFQLPQLAT